MIEPPISTIAFSKTRTLIESGSTLRKSDMDRKRLAAGMIAASEIAIKTRCGPITRRFLKMIPFVAVRGNCRRFFRAMLRGWVWAIASFTMVAAVHAEDGARVYSSRCAACHQADGKGVDGRFPPLKQSLSGWLATPQGRSYLVAAALYGPVGEIKVDGKTYSSIMPAMGRRMNDDEIVAVLRYVGENLNTPPAGYQPFDVTLVASLRSSPTAEDSLMTDRGKLPPR